MKKITHFFTIAALLVLSPLTSLAEETSAAADGAKHFHRACHIDEGDVLTTDIVETNSMWTITHTAFEEDRCHFPYLVYEVKYATEKHQEKIDLTVIETSYTPITEEVAMALNLIRYCGYSDWAKKEKKIVSGYLCDEFKAPNNGDKLFTIFKTEQKNENFVLYIGMPTEGRLGKTSGTRHQSFDKRPFILISQ